MVSVGPRPMLLLWVIFFLFLLYELPVFVLMLQSVSSVVMFLCLLFEHGFTFGLFGLMTAKLK